MRFLFSIFALLAGMKSSAATIKFDWDTPEFSTKKEMGPSDLIEDKTRPIIQLCQVFKKFTLFVIEDPGLKGANYKSRLRQKGRSPAEECALKPNETLTEFAGGALQGAVGTKLIFIDDGMLGDESTLVIVDAHSGKTLFSALHDVSSPVRLEKKNGRISLTYFGYLKEAPAGCDIQIDKTGSCFREVLSFNHVSKSARINKPACPTGADSVALFLEARVADVQKPAPEFIGTKAVCTPRQ